MTAWFLVIFVLCISGAQEVGKYFGSGGVALHCAVVASVLVWGYHRLSQGRPLLSERAATVVMWVMMGGAFVAFSQGYPIAQSGAIGGGSDGDDAIDAAVRAAFAGTYPYSVTTYLGSPATYLPGTLLMAAPFVWLGASAYQNLAWLAGFALAVRLRFGRTGIAAPVLMIALFAPTVWHVLVTGSGILTTSIAVTLGVMSVLRTVRHGHVPWLPALFLGLTVTTRANFMLVLPVVWAYVYRRLGLRAALVTAGVSIGMVAALILPFALYDPATFWFATVLEQNWVGLHGVPGVPMAWAVLPGLSALAAVALAAGVARPGMGERHVLTAAALTQATPVVLAFLAVSIEIRAIHLDFTRYGLHMLFLALMGGWLWLEHAGFLGPGPAHITPQA